MPETDKTFGQAVKQEPSDKLHSADGDQLSAFFLSVFSTKAHSVIFNRLDAAVSNRYPVGVASQVFKYMFGPFDRFANTDDPSFGKKPCFKPFIDLGSQFNFCVLAGFCHVLDELGTKDQ